MKHILVALVVAFVIAGCAAPAAPTAGEATLVVSGGSAPVSFTVAQLKALPQAQSQFNNVTYVGVSVVELLKKAGFKPEEVTSVKAVASDGFSATYDAALFTREDLIVAYKTASGELTKDDGSLRTVLPGGEGKQNVRALSELQVVK